MEKPEGESEVKVKDRRRFDESGTERAGTEERHTPSQPTTTSSNELPPVDFSSFIIGLATQALVFLGEIPDPQTGERALTLDAARNYIDILAMLEQKTEGNLTENEKKLLQEVLTSVRMAFVHKARE